MLHRRTPMPHLLCLPLMLLLHQLQPQREPTEATRQMPRSMLLHQPAEMHLRPISDRQVRRVDRSSKRSDLPRLLMRLVLVLEMPRIRPAVDRRHRQLHSIPVPMRINSLDRHPLHSSLVPCHRTHQWQVRHRSGSNISSSTRSSSRCRTSSLVTPATAILQAHTIRSRCTSSGMRKQATTCRDRCNRGHHGTCLPRPWVHPTTRTACLPRCPRQASPVTVRLHLNALSSRRCPTRRRLRLAR